MTAEEITAGLMQLYQKGRRFLFIQQAQRVLDQVPSAPELTLQTFRVLAELGLGGPARELLEIRGDLGGAAILQQLQSAIAELPDSRVRWGECRATFEQNLSAIRSACPALLQLAEQAPELLDGIDLHRSIQGQYFISRKQAGKLRSWLADLSTLEEESSIKLPPKGKLGPVVIAGVRTGSALDEIYENTHRLYLTFSHPLYWIEPDPVCFAAWLHLADHRKWLGDPRVYLWAGPGAFDGLKELLDDQPRLGIPDLSVNFTGKTDVADRIQQTLVEVHSRRQENYDQLSRRLEERYRNRDAAYWAEHFKQPGTILGVTSRYTTVLQYSMRDMLCATENLGYHSQIELETQDHETLPPIEISQAIWDHDPVLVICIDHHRYEHPCIPAQVPFLCWIQDAMANLLCREAGDSIGDFDFVCGYFPNRCIDEFGYPAEQFEFTNVPVSTAVFHDAPLSAESEAQYACDLCFVSNASTPIEVFHKDSLSTYPEPLRPLLDALYDQIVKLLEENVHLDFQTTAGELVRQTAKSLGVHTTTAELEHLKTFYAHRLFDWGRRHQTLEWAANWARRTGRSLRIYGRGWEQHPRLAEFACGVLEHGEPVRCAYRAATLALQLIPEGFRHQRASEILASGSLPLARYCSVDFKYLPIETFIEERAQGKHPDSVATIFPRLERVVFRNSQEFEEMAEGYLADPALRSEVIGELREVVLQDYTYDAVMERVLGKFQQHLKRAAASSVAQCAV